MDKKPDKRPATGDGKSPRGAKLAEALRANLIKRKQQGRQRKKPATASAAPPTDKD